MGLAGMDRRAEVERDVGGVGFHSSNSVGDAEQPEHEE